jgi:hypothetical protein
MNFHQINSQPRHLRYIFFVDAVTPFSDLVDIMKLNLDYWGGAFNPVVPVQEGKITAEYEQMIRHLDPDIIYYGATIDPQFIKDMGLFNPSSYVNLGEMPLKATISGVSRLHLRALMQRRPIIYATSLWKTESVLLDYFELNFGIRRVAYMGEERGEFGQTVLPMGAENLSTLHADIFKYQPVDYAGLASLYPCTKVLRSFKHVQYNTCELVISAGTGDRRDLLYWWNRNLYEGGKKFFVTCQQLEELVADNYFGPVLGQNCDGPVIDVISFSLTQQDVEEKIAKSLRSIRSERQFRYKAVTTFPYPVDDTQGSGAYVERDPGKQQLLLTGETKFAVAAPAFITGTAYATDTWAIDLQITAMGDESNAKEILLPKTTNVAYLLGGVKGRVNFERRLSYYYQSNTPHIPASVELRQTPTFSAILPQLIRAPLIAGVVHQTPYTGIEIGEPGRRMQSFFRLAEGNLSVVQMYLWDKFWFEMLINCCRSEKFVGDTLSFAQLLGRCQRHIENDGQKFENSEQKQRVLDELQTALKPMVAELVAMKVLFPGYTLSCNHCGHLAWYALEDVAVTIKCSGCIEHFPLPVDPDVSYRLSTLVRRNFYQTPQTADGNGVVIRTILKLKGQNQTSFEYSGQLNIYKFNKIERETDLDIVALDNGEFVIGEAKNDSSQFDKKCLRLLYEVASYIRPDRIVLSCAQDNRGKLADAKEELERHFADQKVRPMVDAVLLNAPVFSIFRAPRRGNGRSDTGSPGSSSE